MIKVDLDPPIKLSELTEIIKMLQETATETTAYHFIRTIERVCDTEATVRSGRVQGIVDLTLEPDFEIDDSHVDKPVLALEITTKSDQVNHPQHYETNGIECFDAIRASQGDDAAVNFAVCNAFKYIWRNQHKENQIQDLEKAIWYLNKAVDILKDEED